MLRKAVIAIIYLIWKKSIPKSCYNRINLFLTFPSFWDTRILLTCHEFSPFHQSFEERGNKCGVKQLTLTTKGMSLGNFNVFFAFYLPLLVMYCLQ